MKKEEGKMKGKGKKGASVFHIVTQNDGSYLRVQHDSRIISKGYEVKEVMTSYS